MQKALVNCLIRRKIRELFGRKRQISPRFPSLSLSVIGRHGKTHKSEISFLTQHKKTGRRQSLRPEGGSKNAYFFFFAKT